MVIGIANTQKVTVTLPKATVEAVRELVEAGKADSVSGFVLHAVRTSLEDITGWGPMLAKALEETGGPMTAEERVWADEVLGRSGTQGAA
ncbi:ribbon-helix-helix domain-containing protein [Nocardioides sp.]|uniref:ribbon-helix-helix domain-containing protein n=1 Tax=Nocardioides sp. TaxID=35761 RepID=UPI0039E3A2CB